MIRINVNQQARNQANTEAVAAFVQAGGHVVVCPPHVPGVRKPNGWRKTVQKQVEQARAQS